MPTTKTVNTTYKPLSWKEEPIKHSKTFPANFVYAVQERSFTGDMEGFGVATYVMTWYDEEKYPSNPLCTYAGQMYFDGTILGKKGTVAINTTGVYDHGTAEGQWVISPETATGELVGMTGKGGYGPARCECSVPMECRLEVDMPH